MFTCLHIKWKADWRQTHCTTISYQGVYEINQSGKTVFRTWKELYEEKEQWETNLPRKVPDRPSHSKCYSSRPTRLFRCQNHIFRGEPRGSDRPFHEICRCYGHSRARRYIEWNRFGIRNFTRCLYEGQNKSSRPAFFQEREKRYLSLNLWIDSGWYVRSDERCDFFDLPEYSNRENGRGFRTCANHIYSRLDRIHHFRFFEWLGCSEQREFKIHTELRQRERYLENQRGSLWADHLNAVAASSCAYVCLWLREFEFVVQLFSKIMRLRKCITNYSKMCTQQSF